MISQLTIVRHGSASQYAANDEVRHLTEQGIREAHAAGRAIKTAPIRILHSTLLRAQQTAKIIHSYFPQAFLEEVDFITPDDSPKQVIKRLDRYSDEQLMIVSHQPLVTSLISLLVDGSNGLYGQGVFLNPANFVEMKFDVFGVGCASLTHTYLG
jgi:phosphohistidine phosphatase